MPALKLLLRRTIASSAVNPPSILSPPASATHAQTPKVYGGVGMRSTLARGCARLRIGGGSAHVKGVTPTIIKQHIMMCCLNNKKTTRVFMLSSSSSSCSFEERETTKTDEFNRVSPLNSSSSSSFDNNINTNNIVAEMGEEKKQNDVGWHPNGELVSPQNEQDQKHDKSSKLLTLPTLLTLARVASIPVFIATFYVNSWWGATATTSIFVAAAITDWLDGYLARRMRLGTAFGAFLDPVADKLMVAATLVLLCSRPPEVAFLGDLPWLFPVPAIAIIGREITMSAVREWAASQDAKLLQAVAVNNLGKWKTATQMTALIIILATRDTSISSQGALAASGVGLLYISAGLAAWSLVVYMSKIWKVLMR